MSAQDGEVFTTSRQVAELFEKEHRNVLRAIRLLECDDPDLFNWLMNHGEPADPELKRMVKLIQQRNHDRGPVAM